MRVRSKLILALVVIVLIATIPLSLYLIETLQKSIIRQTQQAGLAQSDFFAKSIFNLLLTNGGNVQATKVDAQEVIKIFESLQSQGLRFIEALFLSAEKQENGLVLVSWPNKALELEKKLVSLLWSPYFVGTCSLATAEKCMIFTATAGFKGKAASVIVRMEFSEAAILEPVHQLRRSLLFAVLSALLVVLLLGIILNLQITKPLGLLEEATKQLASGNLDYRIAFKGKDEFGKLAMSFNSMSEALKKYIAELNKTHQELTAARSIQQAFLPNSLPKHSQVQFAARFLPMIEVGGDIYDVFETPNGFAILVADVSGHGIPAALITGMAKMAILGRKDLTEKPAEMLQHLNQLLWGQIGNRFLTLVYAYFNPVNHKLLFANGGHPDVFIVDRVTGNITSWNIRGSMVGVFPDPKYEQKEITLRAGERVLFFTDGILECFSPEGRLYEEERLASFLRETTTQEAAFVCDLLLQDIQKFSGSDSLSDDATVVILDINQ